MQSLEDTFQHKVSEFISATGLTDTRDVEVLVSGIVRFSLGCVQYKEVKVIAKDLCIKDLFVEFKQKQLRNSSLVLGRLWRAMLYLAREKDYPPYKMFKVKKSDLVFCESFLKKKDKTFLKRKSKERYVEKPRLTALYSKVLKDLEPIIRYKVRRKLSFIFKYESWLSEEDFLADLNAVAVKNILRYSYLKDINFLKKAVVQKINHEIVDIIYKHTAKKRQNLVRTQLETERVSLVKIIDKERNLSYTVVRTKELEAVYSTKTISLDAPVSSEEDSETTFHDFVSCTKNMFVEEEENHNFIKKILDSLSSQKLRDYVKIITTTDWPSLFERFIKNMGIHNKDLLSLKRLSDLAKSFLGLTHSDLVSGIGPVLRELISNYELVEATA